MNLIIEWNAILLEAIRAVGQLPLTSRDRDRGGPPQVARSIGIFHTAIYDAWSAYDSVAIPVHRKSPRLPDAEHANIINKRKTISQAAYRALINQFPLEAFGEPFRLKYKAMLTAQLAKDGVVIGEDVSAPVELGNQVADDLLGARLHDGSNQENLYADTTDYLPKNNPMAVLLPAGVDAIDWPGNWQSLTYLNAVHEAKTPKFICPQWYLVKPFALARNDQFRPLIPPQSPLSQAYLDQAKHVMDIQVRLTSEQKVVAEYWADGPNSELPPGHWTEFASYVVERDGLCLDDSVKIFFALANAVFDASIATWDAKRAFDYVRPITAIRHLFRGKRVSGWVGAGKGVQEIMGENWRPFQVSSFPTPPFAEFTSGHSGFSMAAATVLKLFTGSDKFGFFYSQDTPLKAEPSERVMDIVLHWPTFTSAAREAGESRLYGGIHFYEGNVVGLDIGEKVGKAVFEKAKNLWSGNKS